MKLKISYVDSEINFDISNIYTLEVYNKKYFYRISSLMYYISNGNVLEEVICFDNNYNEIGLNNKIRFFSEYFDFGFDSKKYSNDIQKYILSNIEQFESEKILKEYNKLCNLVKMELAKFELPIDINYVDGINDVIKMLKLCINQKNELLDNLLLIIDLETIFNSNKVLCFLNLKQYLTKDELVEFYKYAIYNSIKLIMIESTNHDFINEYEKKIIIEQDLTEFVL